jgi:hypothetical protein
MASTKFRLIGVRTPHARLRKLRQMTAARVIETRPRAGPGCDSSLLRRSSMVVVEHPLVQPLSPNRHYNRQQRKNNLDKAVPGRCYRKN